MSTIDDDTFLEACLAQWLERTPNGTTADLDALVAERPHLLPRLRQLAALAAELPGDERAADAPPMDPLTDSLLGGRYKIVGRLGAGGMGLVYAAHDQQLDRDVALKVLDDLFARDAQRVARFQREAQHLAALQHPHIVAVHDFDLHGRPPYLVMDRVDGWDLATVIAAVRATTSAGAVPTAAEVARALAMLDPDWARDSASDNQLARLAQQPWPRTIAEFGLQMGRALSAAHAIGVVHRDVKPGNFMLDRTGRVRLLDFGLARHTSDVTLTQIGTRLGTPLYMAPEQVRGEEATPGSDVYSLGGSLYELACLEPPFSGRGAELEARILYDDPVPPAARRNRLPRDLAAICLKALAKASAQRYGSVDDLLDDLQRFLQFEPVLARPRAWPAPLRRAIGACRRYRRLLQVAATLAIVAAVSASLLGFWFGSDHARAAATHAAERDARARQLHAGLSPYMGFGGSRADRLRDPQRQASLAVLDELLTLDSNDTVARFLRAWLRSEEEPRPASVAADLDQLATTLGTERIRRWFEAVALPLQRRDRTNRAAARSQLLAALPATVETEPLDSLGRRLRLTLLLQLIEVDPAQRRQYVEQAEQLLAASSEPPTAFTHMAQGVLATVDKLYVSAKEQYQLCDRLCPGQPATLHALARLNRLLGDPRAAKPYSAAALAASPAPHPNYLEQHALVLIALDEFDAAARLLEQFPTDGEYANQGLLLRARLCVQQAATAPDQPTRRAALDAGRRVLATLEAKRRDGKLDARQAAAAERYGADADALDQPDAEAELAVLVGLLLDAGGREIADPLNPRLLRNLAAAVRRTGNETTALLFELQAGAVEAARRQSER